MLRLIVYFKFLLLNIFFTFRLKLSMIILPNNSKIYKSLKDLSNYGIAIVPNFHSIHETDNIFNECFQILESLPKDKLTKNKVIPNLILPNGIRVERGVGQIKIKNIQIINKKMNYYANKNNILSFCSLIYNFSFKKLINFIFLRGNAPLSIYHLNHDGSFKNSIINEGVSDTMIAGDVHSDTPFPSIKAFLALKDIKIDNGPMICYKKSFLDKQVKNKIYKCYQSINNVFKSENPYKLLEGDEHFKNYLDKNYNQFKAIGKKGDLVIFDNRSVHYASKLIKGERQLLWFYY